LIARVLVRQGAGGLGAQMAGMIWETFEWILDNPAWSGAIFAGVVLSVVFALPTPRHSKR